MMTKVLRVNSVLVVVAFSFSFYIERRRLHYINSSILFCLHRHTLQKNREDIEIDIHSHQRVIELSQDFSITYTTLIY